MTSSVSKKRRRRRRRVRVKGRDPWRGFDAKDAGEAVFWDSQCGAKKTEHPFPTGRAGDGPVRGERVADYCRGHRWQ